MNKIKFLNGTCVVLFVIMIVGFVSLGVNIYKSSKDVDALKAELIQNQTVLSSTIDELDNTKENLLSEAEKSNRLDESLQITQEELDIANETIADLKSEEYDLVYLGNFKLTHYCSEKYEHICGTGAGITATGTTVTPGRTVAVDPNVIPYGSKIYIEGYGWRYAEDCGGAVTKKQIDIAVDTHKNALAMGVQKGGVWILVQN